jgi:ferrous iron transport protein B
MSSHVGTTAVPIHFPLYRGERRVRIALLGMPNSGKSTLFQAVAATSVRTGKLAGTGRSYEECRVQVGMDEANLVNLPSTQSLHHLQNSDLLALKYLLWGDTPPPISAHDRATPPAPFSPPDVIIQVVDATALERHLELTLELSQLGKPMVLALNRMDEAAKRGLKISASMLERELGVRVIPTIATMGQGISELFSAAVAVVREDTCPIPQPFSPHIVNAMKPLSHALNDSDIRAAFQAPHAFLVQQVAANDPFILGELGQHFPSRVPQLKMLVDAASGQLPRALAEEMHADRHHMAASLFELVSRAGVSPEKGGWRALLDKLFLDPRIGLIGSLAVFALVLFVVFEVGTWLDSLTAVRLIDAVQDWQPVSTGGVVGRAVVEGLIGLLGIVVPYMLPLVLVLVTLEETGVMHRIAFVVDRGFHKIGLHGAVAVPFLLGLGCNVPALSAVAATSRGKERFVASLLITFVPCSARSAVILALAGKYLGGLAVLAIFGSTMLVIALLGKLLTRRYPDSGPGQVQEIPPYSLPNFKTVLATTWSRTSDVLTIVTPLLVAGSVVLALLSHFQADQYINLALTPITGWWLGLPVVLGVPILFGVLRKELSLLMIYQALGGFDVGQYLDWVQIATFLLFLTFYIPCVSTFAVMLKTLGRRDAWFSVALSVGVALIVSMLVRVPMEIIQRLGG